MPRRSRGGIYKAARRRILAAGEYPSAKQFYLYIFAKICYDKYRKAVEYDEIKI